jgi:hypothetical protein
MQIPAFLVGTRAQATKACRKVAKALVAGATCEEVADGQLLTPAQVEGPVVLNATSTSHRQGSFVHAYVLFEVLRQRPLDDAILDRIVREASASPWGVLCLCSDTGRYIIRRNPARRMIFLRGAVNALPQIESLGMRFDSAIHGNVCFHQVPNEIYVNLGALGVDREPMQSIAQSPSPPPGGLGQWVAKMLATIN